MISIQKTGEEPLEIESILIDFEGTLASDGRVHPKAKDKINLLSKRTKIYILAKGEEERVGETLRNVKAESIHFTEGEVSQQKSDFLRKLGASKAVAIGNGMDDASMMGEAGLAICVISKEGTSTEAMTNADVVVMNIIDALDFLLKPLRQKATLGE